MNKHTIHQLFEIQAQQSPSATAVIFEDSNQTQQTVSYQSLNQQANQLAHYLIAQGVGPDTMVGVYFERSVDMLVALLAVLKAGGAYLPLDPAQPLARLEYFIDNCHCRLLLSQADSPFASHDKFNVIIPSKQQEIISNHSNQNPHIPELSDQHLAYIIYTSGSTGKPKGVMIPHANVVHFIRTLIDKQNLSADDRILQFFSFGFDFSVAEIYPALSVGATLILRSEETIRSVATFIEKSTEYGLTQWNLPTAYWHHIIDEVLHNQLTVPPTLRQITFGGEKLLSEKVRQWLSYVGDSPQLMHVYGPTETTVFALSYHLPPLAELAETEISLGDSFGPVTAYVLNSELETVNAQVTGELYLGGPTLARGYRDHQALTDERFIPDPFSHKPGARMYKTGDLVCYHGKHPDGTIKDIEFIGRADDQIKIQGFRVEPDDIQTTLQSHPQVSQAIVIAHENAQGNKQLVAYVLADAQLSAVTSTLQAFLKERLPHYMIPKIFIRLDAFPLNVNGKVDRKALPNPDGERPDMESLFIAATTPTEKTLADIWSNVLNLKAIGIKDNFYDLGGHSLIASQIISRIRNALNIDLSLANLFLNPTVAELAAHIDGHQADSDTLRMTRVERSGKLPVSFAQERVYFLQELSPDITSYQFQATLNFDGELNIPVLEQAINAIIERHEIFRTTFPSSDGKLTQVIHPPFKVSLEIQTLEDGISEQQWLHSQLGQPFALDQLPLVRWHLLQLAPDKHRLVHIEHHMVHDGWSLNIFLAELVELYTAFLEGKPNPLVAAEFQFVDFANWQREWAKTPAAEKQLNYWREQLADAPPLLELPGDRPRPTEQSYQGDSLRMELPLELCQAVREMGQQQQATLYMSLFSTFLILINRHSGQNDLCIGSAVANRQLQETEQLIGMIVNNIVLRVNVEDNPTFDQLLARVRDVTGNGYANEDLPFDKVVEVLRPERNLSYNPIFQVMFSFHDSHAPQLNMPGLNTTLTEGISNKSAKFDLDIVVIPRSEQQLGNQTDSPASIETQGITMIWEFNSDIFDPATIDRLMQQYQRLLKAIIAAPNKPISDYPLLSTEQNNQLLQQWPVTTSPAFTAVHQQIEQQAKQTPNAIALTCQNTQLTYQALNHKANQLAHHLRELNVQAQDLVGVCLTPSADMIITLLAILKAGGAYLSLDPKYPQERLSYMIADSDAKVIISQQTLADKLPKHTVKTVYLDEQQATIARYHHDDPINQTEPAHLAYVIYTSGTTGKPKGVMIEHQAMHAFVTTAIERYNISASDKVLQFASINFDTAVEEIYPTLCTGANLVVKPEQMMHSAADFLNLSADLNLTVWDLPTAYWHFLVRELENSPENFQRPQSLRLIIIGGEAVRPEPVALWHQHFGDKVALINTYGPTESTVVATSCDLIGGHATAQHRLNVPIGKPLAHIQACILDSQLRPTPQGVPGELYLGGPALARGYLNLPELSAKQFITHPANPQLRLYKTGDWVRCREVGGEIEYLGRVDNQVKIRGLRIELSEIEKNLLAHTSVAQAVIHVREDNPGNQRIVAYVVGQQTIDESQLRDHLKKQLPDYMVPSAIITLDAIPLTVNQKVDYQALPKPDVSENNHGRDFVAPHTESQRQLADIWQQVLGLEQVGICDNFFALGGDSILSIQMISRAKQQGIHLTPKLLFKHQTIAELALSHDQGLTPKATAIIAEQQPVTGKVELTPIQHWFFAQNMPQWQHFNQTMLVELTQTAKPAALQQAVNALIAQHDALRANFSCQNQNWQQQFNADANQAFVVVDLSETPKAQQEQKLRQLTEQYNSGINPQNTESLRAVLIQRGHEQKDLLLLIVHHLSVDGVSWRILLEDLNTAYQQTLSGKAIELPAKTSSMQSWANKLIDYAQTPAIGQQADYWLQNAQPLSEATPVATSIKNSGKTTFVLDSTKTEALLKSVPAAYNTQINDVLLTALLLSHYQCTGERALKVDLEGHGREDLFDDIDISRTVGWFTTLFPVRFELPQLAEPTLAPTLMAVKEQLRAIPNKGIGYGVLRYLNQDAHIQSAFSQLTDAPISFNYLGQFDQVFNAAGDLGQAIEIKLDQASQNPDSHPLAVAGLIKQNQLNLILSFDHNHYSEKQVQQLGEQYLAVLQQLIDHCLSADAGGYTPSDFPLCSFNQSQLDQLIADKTIDDIYPLSPMQQGMLFHTLKQPNQEQYFEQLLCTFDTKVNGAVLEQVWQTLIKRHSILRASYHWQSLPAPVQVIHSQASASWQYFDWSELPLEQQQQALAKYQQQDRRQGFDLEQASLMRFALIKVADAKYHWLWSHHHLLFDGWSMPVLLQEMRKLYQAQCQQQSLSLPKVRPYRDYIAMQQQQDKTAAQNYWQAYLAGFDTPSRVSLPKPTTSDNNQHHEQWFELDSNTSAKLQDLAKSAHVTLNNIIQGAWAILLNRYSGENDVLFGATVSGRSAELSGIENMVGLFINSLPIRAQISTDSQLLPWLKQLQQGQIEHNSYEYSSLVDIQQATDVPATSALFDSLLVFESYPKRGLLTKSHPHQLHFNHVKSIERTNYPLTVVVNPDEQLKGRVIYQDKLFNHADIVRLTAHLQQLLGAIASDSQQTIGQLVMLNDEQIRQQYAINQQSTPKPHSTLAELFETQVTRTPNATAVSYGDQSISYQQLNQKANQMAHYLRERGVKPNQLVGVTLAPSIAMVVSYVAIIKAGGAYLPLDNHYPQARLELMVKDSQMPLLIADDTPSWCPNHVAIIDWHTVEIEQQPQHNPDSVNSPEDLAYVLYTSGSTGTPKGVMIPHRSIKRLVINNGFVDLLPQDKIAQVSSPSFDAITFEIWGALLNGAQLVGIDKNTQLQPEALIDALQQQQISVMLLTVALFHQMVDYRADSFNSLRTLIFGGDAASPHTVAKVLNTDSAPQLINGYGPTECTTFALTGHIEQISQNANAVPLDRPITDTQVYLLDHNGQPVPTGVAAEIHLAGDGLALGYLNQPQLTAKSFIDHELGRLYKTGDLARFIADDKGNPSHIEFIGRVDHQVKIRGYRIETGEIAVALNLHPNVNQAFVIASNDSEKDKQLIAYVVTQSSIQSNELLAFLQHTLPDYMLPSHIITLDTFPLTTNGKIDRHALPTPSQQSKEIVAPQTQTEQTLAEIWQQLLAVPVSLHDNFFAIGGHSLKATQAVSRIRDTFAIALPLQSLFEYPELSQLAAHIDSLQVEQAPEAALEQLLDELGDIDDLSDEQLEQLLAQE